MIQVSTDNPSIEIEAQQTAVTIDAQEIAATIDTPQAVAEISIFADAATIELGDHNEVAFDGFETYDGLHTVTPTRSVQRLETKNKIVKKDIVIKEVPFSETSNTAGGTTFYIAMEVEEYG